jgi:hypothetical protein
VAPKQLDEDELVTVALRSRLKKTYNYYRELYTPESYTRINPLAQNLYFLTALTDLRRAFPSDDLQLSTAPATLKSVVERCAPEDVYCRVVARRILGLAHTSDEDFVAGESAFRDALTEAKEVNLDSEIGHLHRLFGWALMRLGRLDEAEQEQIEALKHEENPEFRYWKALSLAELGDVRLRKAESRGLSSFDPQSPPFDSANLPPDLTSVSKAYVDCIRSFELAVSSLVVPVARAVEQQLMRSYADNAIQIAAIRPGNLVGAIEAFGPRYANDLVSEARVAATFDASRQLDSEPGLCNFTIPYSRLPTDPLPSFRHDCTPPVFKKASISFSREHKNSKKSTFLYLRLRNTQKDEVLLNSRGRRRPFNNVSKRSKCLHRVFGVIVVPWYAVITEKSKELLPIFLKTLLTLRRNVALPILCQEPLVKPLHIREMLFQKAPFQPTLINGINHGPE